MANFSGLQSRLATKGRMDTTQSGISTFIQQALNEAGKEIWELRDWYFTVSRQVVQTNADIKSGTVSVNAGATAVTGVGTGFTTSMVGYFIQFSTTKDWYAITAVASATSLTIEIGYVGATNGSGLTYTIRQRFVSLGSTVDKIMTARQAISPAYLDVVNYRDFDIYRPDPLATGDPRIMILFGYDSSNNLRFTPYPWPQTTENIEIRFKLKWVDMVNGSDTTLIPDKWNETVMIENALSRVYQYQDDGSNPSIHQRWVNQRQFADSQMQRMIAAEVPDASYHPIIGNRDKVNVAIGPILPFKYGPDM